MPRTAQSSPIRALVTGGSGFIGAHLVRMLVAQGWQVCNLDALTYAADPDAHRDLDQGYRFVHGDVCDPQAVERAWGQGVDALFHLAAESHVDRSLADGAPFLRTNVMGTQVLLEAARRLGLGNAGCQRSSGSTANTGHFVLVSTDEVHGELAPDAPPCDAHAALNPSNPYAASKAAAELLARSHARSFGVPVSVTRCSNNYGPGQHAEKLIPTLVRHAAGGEPLPIYGDGLQIRDWIHVLDHCRALIHVAGLPPGQTWVIGARCERTNRALAQRVVALLGGSLTQVTDRLGHDRRYALDPSALEATGWQAQVGFDAGFAETVLGMAKARPTPVP